MTDEERRFANVYDQAHDYYEDSEQYLTAQDIHEMSIGVVVGEVRKTELTRVVEAIRDDADSYVREGELGISSAMYDLANDLEERAASAGWASGMWRAAKIARGDGRTLRNS